jgi:hypothetical protein
VTKKNNKVEYEVVGTHAVHGHEPGTTFSAELSAEQEQQLIDGGHLAVTNHKEA